ncbi:MAG: MaoC family dehydratase [Blastocatellia bacterium]|nr:MaoC family dehydratase [Blastocatellia bacterium]MBN8725419.1 MaoC family dehydratase [Acidobacteriota bacterium]
MNNIQINKTFSTNISFTQADINKFAEISGDKNPIHIDLEYAAKSRFGKTIAHGMLVYSVISEYLNKEFPKGKQLSQELAFLSPVYTEEELFLMQQITTIKTEEQIVEVKTSVTKTDGTLACQSLTLLKLSN